MIKLIDVKCYLNVDADKTKLIKDIDTKDYTLIHNAINKEQLEDIKTKVINEIRKEHQDNNIQVNFIDA